MSLLRLTLLSSRSYSKKQHEATTIAGHYGLLHHPHRTAELYPSLES